MTIRCCSSLPDAGTLPSASAIMHDSPMPWCFGMAPDTSACIASVTDPMRISCCTGLGPASVLRHAVPLPASGVPQNCDRAHCKALWWLPHINLWSLQQRGSVKQVKIAHDTAISQLGAKQCGSQTRTHGLGTHKPEHACAHATNHAGYAAHTAKGTPETDST